MGAGCMEGRGTVVVDVTYACNAECRYCRWGDRRRRGMPDASASMIPGPTLRLLGTRRIVLSGGEPTLHPRLGEIVSHYAGLVDEVVVITNGYSLARGRAGIEAAGRLVRAGATGITFSVDSADPREMQAARGTPPAVHAAVLRLVEGAASSGVAEVGINATVTGATARWRTVSGLLGFGRRAGVDFVKFQPVFDDGYASANAPGLLLSRADAPRLLDIAARLEGRGPSPAPPPPPTNPPGFWRDVAALAAGEEIPASGCALGPTDAISTGGVLSVCSWVGGSRYGPASGEIEEGAARAVQARFPGEKARCTVGPHCFCNQGMGHVWA